MLDNTTKPFTMRKINLSNQQKWQIFMRMPFVFVAILFGTFTGLMFGFGAYAEFYQLENVDVQEGFLFGSFIPILLWGWVFISIWKFFKKVRIIEEGELIEATQFNISKTDIQVNGSPMFQYEIDYTFRGQSHNFRQKTTLSYGNSRRIFLLVHPTEPSNPVLVDRLPDQLKMQLFTSK